MKAFLYFIIPACKMTCTKRLRILFFTLSLSLLFPKQKRAWGGWCLIPSGSWSRETSQVDHQAGGQFPQRSRVRGSDPLPSPQPASQPPALPRTSPSSWHKWPLISPSWGGGSYYLLRGCELGCPLSCFLSSQDYFPSPFCIKKKNSRGREKSSCGR